MRPRCLMLCLALGVLVAAFGALAPARSLHAQRDSPAVQSFTRRTVAVPYGASTVAAQQAGVDRAELQERYLARRERQAAAGTRAAQPVSARPEGRPQAPPARLAASEAAGDLVTVRNHQNAVALTDSSATAGPATASKGLDVLYTGNWYASYSSDGGAHWSAITIPAGPADAPYLCCDMDVLYDPGQDTFFWSALYVNNAVSNGAVRVFVQPAVSGPYSCFFDIDPGGAALNVLPDYPHLGLSNNYLYISTNNDGEWQVWRYPTAELTACATATAQVIAVPHTTYGHRVVVPVRGATTQMYWGLLENSSTFRIFTWPEAASSAGSTARAISASAFANPACNGGAGNHDFIERDTAWTMNGFRLRGAVGAGRLTFMWNSAPAGGIPYAHIRAATFDEATLNLTGEPHLYLADRCTGYPQLATSAAGHIGVTGAMGGGTSGTAAQGFVTVDDDLTSGNAYAPLITVATATNNQQSGRYGGSTTIQPQGGCGNLWVAAAYGLEGGEAAANVNARYVLFGRERDNCDALPPVPGNLRVTATTSTSVSLAWDDVTGETSYRIGRLLAGDVTQFLTVAGDQTGMTDSGLTPGGQYYYWIQACAAGCSAWTAAISVQTPPPLPANFRLTGASAGAISMAWDNVAGETAYQIAWVLSTSPAAFTFQSIGQDVLAWSHSGVVAGATYYYWLRACAGGACSPWSGAITATAAVTPAIPAGLRIAAASGSQIDLAWNDVADELAFELAWTAASPISYQFATLAAGTLTWGHTAVSAGMTYYYHVRACAGVNCSAWSGGIAATAAAAPGIPGNFQVTGSTGGSLSLAWEDVAGETAYHIAYTRTSPISYQHVSAGAGSTSLTLTGLAPATTYYLHIRACTGATCSNYHPGIAGATTGARPDFGRQIPLPPSTSGPLPAPETGRAAEGAYAPPDAGAHRPAPAPPPDSAPPPLYRRATLPPPPAAPPGPSRR